MHPFRASAPILVLFTMFALAACGDDDPLTNVVPDAGLTDGGALDSASPDAMTSPDASTPCAAGFEGTVETGCVDIDECDDVPGACDALTTCTNTDGGFTCGACPEGYAGNGERGCFDIDECAFGACDARTTCTNTAGDFTCSACPENFTGDGKSGCDAVNACEDSTCGEHSTCVPTGPTTHTCLCERGYFDAGIRGCIDVDECAFGLCGPGSLCENTEGSVECSEPLVQNTITVGIGQTCAIYTDGTLKCWGANSSGQLGYGDTNQRNNPPAEGVALGGRATSISANRYTGFTCALLENGTVKCWGQSGPGWLGDGTQVSRDAPSDTPIALPRRAVAVSAGYVHACVILDDGRVTCWGLNGSGELGVDTDGGYRSAPTPPIDLGKRAIAISAGFSSTCALLEGGDVTCWGDNSYGQLGYGDTVSRLATGEIVELGRPAIAVDTDERTTCAILDNGDLKCWGSNNSGQLGLGASGEDKNAPLEDPIDLGGPAVKVSVGASSVCAVLANGRAKCWGSPPNLGVFPYSGFYAPQGTPIPFEERVVDIANFGSPSHACALLESGNLSCWGSGGSGQLGYGDTNSYYAPRNANVVFPEGTKPLSIRIRNPRSCAVLDSGDVTCWGYGGRGYEGSGSTAPTALPQWDKRVDLLGDATSVELGGGHACALLTDGRVQCWGTNGFGQLGYGDEDTDDFETPEGNVVALGAVATQIAVGSDASCALLTGGTVKCWGPNGSGQLGIGLGDEAVLYAPSADPVSLGAAATQVVAGDAHVCALLTGGSVKCWGRNDDGQLGIGSNENAFTPASVALSEPAIALAATASTTCAILMSGDVTCWGAIARINDGDDSDAPAEPFTLEGAARAISVASGNVCVILEGGALVCWGANGDGQLGLGDNTDRPTPGDALVLRAAASSVYVDGSNTCVIYNDDEMQCWGSDQTLQGYGTRGASNAPPGNFRSTPDVALPRSALAL